MKNNFISNKNNLKTNNEKYQNNNIINNAFDSYKNNEKDKTKHKSLKFLNQNKQYKDKDIKNKNLGKENNYYYPRSTGEIDLKDKKEKKTNIKYDNNNIDENMYIKIDDNIKKNFEINDINQEYYNSNLNFNFDKEENNNKNYFPKNKNDKNNNNLNKAHHIDYTLFSHINNEIDDKKIKYKDNKNKKSESMNINKNQKLGYIKTNRNQSEISDKNNSKEINEIINELKEENLKLKSQNEILNVSLIQKEQIIEDLNNKIKNLDKIINNNNYKNFNNFNIKEDYLKNEINKLKEEKDELYNQNKKLTLGINSFNERVKEISEMYTKKNKIYIDEINSYKVKLTEYKRKIILLKKKIDELYNKGGKQNIISLFNYHNEYGYNNQGNEIFFKNRNLTPIRIMNKNKSYTVKRNMKGNEASNELNLDNEESNLHKEQKQFVQDYKNFLDNLKY